jgi:hypothetical protein
LFIINEHEIISNMARRTQPHDLEPYRPLLEARIPKAVLRVGGPRVRHFDGVLTFEAGKHPVRYLVEEKRHLRFQDVAVVINQLRRRRADVAGHAEDRLLLLAPHIRPQQAEALERAGIDYLDLAGNAHLAAEGLFVHVEGKRPPKAAAPAPRRPNKAWVKTVMAILIRPELADAPYRTLAEGADVALGTVAACIGDLTARGLVTERAGTRTIRDRQALVALWVQAYCEALRPKLKELRIQVRAADKPALWEQLHNVLAPKRHAWAITGADAAERRTHFFRAEETEIYAATHIFEQRDVQKALVGQPAPRGGNLLVIEPPGPLAVPETAPGTLPMAPDLLAYAELRYRGTGQALEAAELLLPRVLGDAAD